jgi:hypothetical protein
LRAGVTSTHVNTAPTFDFPAGGIIYFAIRCEAVEQHCESIVGNYLAIVEKYAFLGFAQYAITEL